MTRRPCGRARRDLAGEPCGYPRMTGKQRCSWHWLLAQSATTQAAWAGARLAAARRPENFVHTSRVKPELWPEGERWCAGCQSMVPFFYTSGSRCKSCASAAAHGQAIERQYGITSEDYDALLKFQGGRCYICRRKPVTKRLAVDHDHKKGVVRGLLCANNENGCNRAVVANLEAAVDGGLAAARRAVQYLEHPPYAVMKAGGVPVGTIVINVTEPPKPPPF